MILECLKYQKNNMHFYKLTFIAFLTSFECFCFFFKQDPLKVFKKTFDISFENVSFHLKMLFQSSTFVKLQKSSNLNVNSLLGQNAKEMDSRNILNDLFFNDRAYII